MDTTIQGKNSTYHIIKPLKSGGMGEGLLARDDMDRRVAIKCPFASALADGLARFKVESQAAALDHPNIAKIYEAGIQSDGRPYLAMEFVDGKSLKEIIDSGESLDLLVKLSVIEQVCAGLGYAHQKARAEEFLAVENYADALAQLREGYGVVPTSQELKDRIALVTNPQVTVAFSSVATPGITSQTGRRSTQPRPQVAPARGQSGPH